ncbi:MAG TPA: CBS domain-containing protein [Actinocrinis sp.]|nr:CBS domain-containing protein [Actinocrinis sp.]HEV3169076.1 CBS domain-containing protein [Actinocrinis sp.]
MSEAVSLGPPAPADGARVIRLSELLRRPLADRGGESLGRVTDVIVRLRGADYPPVIGLVAKVNRRQVFIPIAQAASFDGAVLKLASAKVDLRHFERRDGEVLLRADVLGHRLIDVHAVRFVRARDLDLAQYGDGWVLRSVDVRRPGRLGSALGRRHAGRTSLDWAVFEPLIGHTLSASARGSAARIGRLKPAQIADLLENASKQEQQEILDHVHADPELEADVFEELAEDRAARLLDARTDGEIAAVLARMRADDAADAIGELPQRRRQPVLDLLPAGQRTKVLTLMGFNPGSAGGLMGVDFIAMPAATSVGQALSAVRAARTLQPEALTSVQVLDESGRLRGVATLVALVQAEPNASLAEVCDTDPVRVGPDTDMVDVAVLMADHNLITVPVVDGGDHPLGVITVDDILEATLPQDWRRREPAPPPSAGHPADVRGSAIPPAAREGRDGTPSEPGP